MDKSYLKAENRARKGTGRKDRICSVRIPEDIKERLDGWKAAYEKSMNRKVSYEQMFTWWMDNIGYSEGRWDRHIREMVSNAHINVFNSKAALVSYLNRRGRFWEYCNNATEEISDDALIEKCLLFLEFEDMSQLFSIFGKDRCFEVFQSRIKSKGKYYSSISFLLEAIFF